MNVPLSWLQDLIDLPDSIEELCDLLTFSGLEVEGVETVGSTFEGIVVAEIVSIRPHPDADKLTLCTIDFGGEEQMEVVCGAPNVRVGMKTIYAPVGTTLPNGLKLKKAKIRGVVSLGMLCAEDELGLSGDHAGIMDLSSELTPGTPAVDVLGAPETVFELEITPNRPDCLGVIGVARELSALTGNPLKLPQLQEAGTAGRTPFPVTIEDAEKCPRYTARAIDGVTLAPSPEWMQNRLRLCGVRPINNLVDITNYVMLETGHPLHAFDRELLRGDRIIVRAATPGEAFTTLDEREHELTSDDLVIADGEGAIALAGIMGGANSEIRETTTRVILESAAFDSATVRHSAKRLDVHTDSSYRFARGCNIPATSDAGQRAADLILELAGGELVAPVADAYPAPQKAIELTSTWSRITDLIGLDIPVGQMRSYFERLELEILSDDGATFSLRVPGHRLDLTRPVDLVEEVARLNGLDNIPAPTPNARIVHGARDPELRMQKRIWSHLADRGFLETLSYSLTSEELLDRMDTLRKDSRVVLPNPISQDQSVLRTSLIPQLVCSLSLNRSRQVDALAMFEVGKTYGISGGEVFEHLCIGMALMGPTRRATLDRQRTVTAQEAFLNLKGELEQFVSLLGIQEEITYVPSEDPTFTPGQGADLQVRGNTVGRIGLLNPVERDAEKFQGPVAVAEIQLNGLLLNHLNIQKMSPIPDVPSVSRDVALIVDRGCTHQNVMDVVNQQRPGDLEDVQLFDLFTGDKLGKDKKSLAYRFTYRNAKKTLTDKAVEKMHRRIEDRLMAELPATIEGR